MGRWAYHLQNQGEDEEATHWRWLDWQDYGDIKLSPRRVRVGDDREAMLDDIAIFEQLPDAVFESPAALE